MKRMKNKSKKEKKKEKIKFWNIDDSNLPKVSNVSTDDIIKAALELGIPVEQEDFDHKKPYPSDKKFKDKGIKRCKVNKKA